MVRFFFPIQSDLGLHDLQPLGVLLNSFVPAAIIAQVMAFKLKDRGGTNNWVSDTNV